MDDALLVRRFKSSRNLDGQPYCFLFRQRAGERLTFDVFQNQVVVPYVVNLADVRLLTPG